MSPIGEDRGVWVAFNYDGSAFVPFSSELEAYRYAAGYLMTVKFAQFGDPDWMRRHDNSQPTAVVDEWALPEDGQ